MNKIPFILIATLFLISSGLSFAQTYRWVDEEGVTHFSQQEPSPSQTKSLGTHALKPNANQIAEKEQYLQERAELEQQISGTTVDQRREQLQRQLQMLDYQWLKKTDPAKAEALSKEMNDPKLRVIQKKEDPDNMKKYKAFY